MIHHLTCRHCHEPFGSLNYKAKFCSPKCFHVSQVGRRRPQLVVPREQRLCRTCGKAFMVGGADGALTRTCCSLSCAARLPRGRRTTKATARTMSAVEAAWFAGVFDGEGYVICSNKNYPTPTFILGISNTCLPFMEKVLEVAGCGRLTVDRRQTRDHSCSWKWTLSSSRNTAALLVQIFPWLIVKRARAEKAIAGERWENGFDLSPGKARQIRAAYGVAS